MLLTLATLACFAPQGPGTSPAPVCINEVSYDDDGGDDLEFVELYSRVGTPVDISGWSIVGYDGTATSPSNGSYTFAGTPGSMTTVINPGQYLLISMATVPNHDPNHVLPSTMMENGADGITLEDDLGNVIDSVVWEYELWTNPAPVWVEGDGIQGAFFYHANVAHHGHTAQRWLDGWDDDNNGLDFVFMEWTPGGPNGLLNLQVPPIVDDFDGLPGTIVDQHFHSSWVVPVIGDPLVIVNSTTPATTWAIPPSPQGGNVLVMHDPSGGGNAVHTRTFPSQDMLVECYVYLEPNPAFLATDGEAWGIGVGTTDSYGEPVDAPGTYRSTIVCSNQNGAGATGIAWFGYHTLGQIELYLVDMGDGGAGFTVLGAPIVVTTGSNDGWQRLRLRVAGSDVTGNFGGTFGVDDGQRITATVPVRKFSQVYFQYRECVSLDDNLHPLVIDRLEIYPSVNANITIAGTASPTTVALPAIGTAGGLPVIGSTTFEFNASGLIPGGISLLVLDSAPLLPGIPIPGMPATVLAYVAPTYIGTVFNSFAGTATAPLPIPGTNSLVTAVLSAQFYDLDPGLGTPLPFGSSEGCQIVIGN